MEKSDTPTKKSEKDALTKRPYKQPRLSEYGDLRLRTWAKTSGSASDKGIHPLNRT